MKHNSQRHSKFRRTALVAMAINVLAAAEGGHAQAAFSGGPATTFKLTLLDSKNGSVIVKDSAGKVYMSGDTVASGTSLTITARPQSRFALGAWTGNAEALCQSSTSSCSVSAVNSNLILGAQFKLVTFLHPGGLVDTDALTRIRNALAQSSDTALAPIAASNAKMFAEQTWMPTPAQLDQGATINYTARPTTIFYRNYTGPGLGGGNGAAGVCPAAGTDCRAYQYKAGYEPDAYAAFNLALQYKITGRKPYADKAVEILNAWGSTFQQFAVANGSYDGMLETYIYGYLYFTAAELLRDYSGWKSADFTAFQRMAKKAFYPILSLGYGATYPWGYVPTNTNGWLGVWSNWFIGPMQSLAAYAILMDDADSFNYAVDYFKKGWTNGQIDRLVYYVHPGNLGQNNESVRDQGHTPLALGQLSTFAHIVWGQGVDLYSYDNYRILAGAEYEAKSNLTLSSVKAGSCSDSHPENCYVIPVMWYQGINGLGGGRGSMALNPLTVISQVYERYFGLQASYSHQAKNVGGIAGLVGEFAPYSDLWATRPYDYAGAPGTWVQCAIERSTCTVPTHTLVRYGTSTRWVTQTMSGSFACDNSTFVDPARGVQKACSVQAAPASTADYTSRPPVLSAKSRTGSAQLSWFGSRGVGSYSVQRSTDPNTGYQTVASGITDLLTYTDTPTQAGTYYYRVVGTDVSGNALTSPSASQRVVVGKASLRNELSWCQNTSTYENDPSGAAFYATLGSGVTRTTENGVPVLNFDGTANAYVHLPDNLNVGLGDYSVSAWVKWSGGNTWTSLLSLGNSGARYAAIQLNSGSNGSAYASSLNGGWDQQTLRGPTLTQGAWTHVVLTFTGSYCSTFGSGGTCTQGGNTATLYINGQQAAQLTGIRNDLDDIGSTTHNYLGLSQNPADNNYSGKLGTFRIYDGALGASEVTQLYQAGLGCIGNGPGLTANYYGNMNLNGNPLLTRIETPMFNWGYSGPATGVPADNFSASWSGKVQAIESGTYQFRAYADDGVRVWVDGRLVIDDWSVHAPRTATSTGVTLTAGQQVSVVVQYFENTGQALLGLYWLRPGGSWQAVPTAQLFP